MSKKKKTKKTPTDKYRGVVLRLYDKKLDPDSITRKLGIQPTECWKRGYLVGKSGKKYFRRYGQWNLRPSARKNARLQAKVEKLWLQLEPKKKELRSILRKVKADIRIAVDAGSRPCLWWYPFKSQLIRNFVSLGIDVEFAVQNF
jgi:hypothetical protein